MIVKKFIKRYMILLTLLLLGLSLPGVSGKYVEILDQKQEQIFAVGTILSLSPAGQEFTPSITPLASVEIQIMPMNPGSGDDTITINIRESTITGAILGSSSKLVSTDFHGWLRFDLPDIVLTPGSLYIIEVIANKDTFGWRYWNSNVYPGGRPIVNGSPW